MSTTTIDDSAYAVDMLMAVIAAEDAEQAAVDSKSRTVAIAARLDGGEALVDQVTYLLINRANEQVERLRQLRGMLSTPTAGQAGDVVSELGWVSALMDLAGEPELARRARSLSCLVTSPAENQVAA